jgi:hypothetical protein
MTDEQSPLHLVEGALLFRDTGRSILQLPTSSTANISGAGLGLSITELDVGALLGKLESITRKYEGQYFWNCPSLGHEV